jgi:hypothetical protein
LTHRGFYVADIRGVAELESDVSMAQLEEVLKGCEGRNATPAFSTRVRHSV